MQIDLTVNLSGQILKSPLIAVSGTAGYGPELTQILDIKKLGAITTKTITERPRGGNKPPRIAEVAGGLINSIGLANIGIDQFIEKKYPLICKLGVPVIVNIAGESIEEYCRIAEKLNSLDKIFAVELNISCPNISSGGIEFGKDPKIVEDLTASVKKITVGKKLIVKLTPNVTDITEIAAAAVQAGADILSLINTLYGMAIDIWKQRPIISRGFGGVSGPAIKPIAIYNVWRVYTSICRDRRIPIIGIGGIFTWQDAIEMMLAGATAVGIGTGIFSNHLIAEQITEGIRSYCKSCRIDRISSLTGIASSFQ